MVMDYDNFAVAVVVDWALSGMPTIGVFAVTEFDMVNVCEFWYNAVHCASSYSPASTRGRSLVKLA
jgi:hypothetical protein